MALTQINSEGIKDNEVKNADMANDAVGIAELSATGTASSSTFLRGDNSWVTPTDTNTQLSTEEVQDIVGGMFTGNTETNITATYQDADGTIDLVSTDTNTQLAFANDANNRVVTGDGSGGLNGEANLTFDAGALEITGNSAGDGLSITNDGDHYTELSMDADRGSAANALGIIQGKWNNNSVCSIYLQSGSDTSNKDDGQIAFNTSAASSSQATRMVVKNNGDVEINDGNLVIGTGGHGIDFSAQTQSSSTTDEELLDHYEKGKWTPVVKKNNVANGTATVIHGRYVRIGKLCFLSMYARWNSGSNAQGTSGGWAIHGLPFTLQDDDPGTCRIYQSAPAGYMTIDGTSYEYSENARWRINVSTYLDLYSNISSADQAWTTGMMAVAFTGCFMIHE